MSMAQLIARKKAHAAHDSGTTRDPLATYELDSIVEGFFENPCDIFVCHYSVNAERLKRLGFEVSLRECNRPDEYLVSVASEVSSGIFQENKEPILAKNA